MTYEIKYRLVNCCRNYDNPFFIIKIKDNNFIIFFEEFKFKRKKKKNIKFEVKLIFNTNITIYND